MSDTEIDDIDADTNADDVLRAENNSALEEVMIDFKQFVEDFIAQNGLYIAEYLDIDNIYDFVMFVSQK